VILGHGAVREYNAVGLPVTVKLTLQLLIATPVDGHMSQSVVVAQSEFRLSAKSGISGTQLEAVIKVRSQIDIQFRRSVR